ncbi:MAG: hypothetical protein ABIZ56_10805, partial [Chthoniobacteraceae bacterium]
MPDAARTFATFICDSPDEPEFSHGGTGDLIRPGGRELADYIRLTLAHCGVTVSDLDQHEYYGWAFTATPSNVPVFCLLQGSDPWILLTDVDFRFWHRL